MATPQTYFSANGFLVFAADLAHIAGADGTQSDARRRAYDALGAARYILIRSHRWVELSHQTATAALLAFEEVSPLSPPRSWPDLQAQVLRVVPPVMRLLQECTATNFWYPRQ